MSSDSNHQHSRGTLINLLENRLRQTPDRIYLNYRGENQEWKGITWKEYGSRIENFSRSLIALGVNQKDKVAIIGASSPDWFVADMSIMTIGGVTVPIYFTSSGEQIQYIIDHSEAKIFIVLGDEYITKIEKHLDDVNKLERIILINCSRCPKGNPLFMDFKIFETMGDQIAVELLQARRASVTPEEVATYVYTSGTTGPPKAVMITHKNCYAAAISVDTWQKAIPREREEQARVPCFLTLAHVFERNSSLVSPLLTGASIYFADISKPQDELRAIQPSVVGGLPRTWEKIYETIMANRNVLPKKKQKIFDWAVKTGYQYNKYLYEKRSIPLTLRIKHAVSYNLVIKKILDALGFFKNAKHILTGGAVSSKEIIDFFFSLGLWICQVYGQTEVFGMGSVETRENMKFGSVGKPFPNTDIKIAEDGEIMIRSDMVSPGYYKDPELTKDTFKEGWLYSGDLGYIDNEGYVFITGRKKDIIITSGAKNITPAKIEASLMSSPLIEHAVVVGDGRKYLASLLTLNFEEGQNWAKKKGLDVKDYESLMVVDELRIEIEKHINDVNQKYSRVEQIKKFTILPEPLSIESGELTSLSKIKRFVVTKKYSHKIDEMYL